MHSPRSTPTPTLSRTTAVILPAIVAIFALSASCASGSTSLRDSAGCAPAETLSEYTGCTKIDGDVLVEHVADGEVSPLSDVTTVTGSLTIRNSPELTNLDPLRDLEHVGGDVHLVRLPRLESLRDLDRLTRIDGQLHIVDVAAPRCEAELLADRSTGRDNSDHPTIIGVDDDPGACTDNSPAAPTDADLPIDDLPELEDMRRGDLLDEVHPELVDRIRLMYALLQAEGIELVFVSGHRPHAGFDRPNRLASWHHLGMAVDLNLAHRSSLDDSTAHFDDDRPKWERIGEIAKGLGIIWGKRYDDIFHFEWHPGYHSRIRDHEYEQFQRLAGDDLQNHPEVWHLFDAEHAHPDAPKCFGGCYHIPDDGLRHLLEQLR